MQPTFRLRFLGAVYVAAGLLACGSGAAKVPEDSRPAGGNGGQGGNGAGGGQGGSGSAGQGGGGASPGHTTPAYRSGSRLRAKVQDGGGGAVVLRGWHDAQMNEDCSFRTAQDNKIRCLPDTDDRVELQYLDAACTQPVAVRSCGSTSTHAVEIDQTACDAATAKVTVYDIGALVPTAPTYLLAGTSCLPAGTPGAGSEIHEVTPAAPSGFVEASLIEEPRGDRLLVRILDGEDGSLETIGLRDIQLDSRCSPERTGPSEIRCAPEVGPLIGGTFYKDMGCVTPLLADMGTPANCPAPSLAPDDSVSQGCEPSWGAVAVGAPVASGASLYQGPPNVCAPASFVPTEWKFYERGAALDSSSLALMVPQVVGTGSLHMDLLMTEGGLPLLPSGVFHDGQRGKDCFPHPFAAGEIRCVPEDVARVDLFSDAACTVPLATVVTDPSCPGALPSEAVTRIPPSDPSCPGESVIDHVYEVGAPFTGLVAYRKTGPSSCTAINTAQLGVSLHTISSDLGAATYPEIVERTE